MDRLLAKIKGSLMAGFNLITSFLQQATAQGTRSTILNPLGWMFSMCVAAVLGAVAFKAPMWITVIFSCFSGLTGLLYLATYVFCLLTKRENLLRTEKFLIQQLAIEKGFVGDSMTGLLKLGEDGTKMLGEGSAEQK